MKRRRHGGEMRRIHLEPWEWYDRDSGRVGCVGSWMWWVRQLERMPARWYRFLIALGFWQLQHEAAYYREGRLVWHNTHFPNWFPRDGAEFWRYVWGAMPVVWHDGAEVWLP